MSKRDREAEGRLYQAGEFWLDLHPRSKFWQICRYDERTGQVRWKSTSTEDFGEAQKALDEHFIEARRPKNEPPEAVLLDEVLADYLEIGLAGKPRQDPASHAVTHINHQFAGYLVAELSKAEQEDFVKALRAKGYAGSYIDDILGTLKAAINFAIREEQLCFAPHIISVDRGDPKDYAIELEELAALIDAIEEEHVLTWMAVSLNTLCRPGNALDLTRPQCDFRRALVNLNPKGRRQTKKYRPIVPMTDAVTPHLQVESDYIVTYTKKKRPIGSIKRAFRATKKRAGLDEPWVRPYSVRHTMARLLRQFGVPDWEVQGMLGHKKLDTTEIYAPYVPDYLGQARRTIDAIVQELNDMVTLDLLWTRAPANENAIEIEVNKHMENIKNRMVGAAGIEPATPTMSTSGTPRKTAKIQQLRTARKGRN